MKQIVDKLKSLESDKLKFKEFLKETLLTHEPFEELNEIKEIYPDDFREVSVEIVKYSINSTKKLIQELKQQT